MCQAWPKSLPKGPTGLLSNIADIKVWQALEMLSILKLHSVLEHITKVDRINITIMLLFSGKLSFCCGARRGSLEKPAWIRQIWAKCDNVYDKWPAKPKTKYTSGSASLAASNNKKAKSWNKLYNLISCVVDTPERTNWSGVTSPD